MQTDAPLFPYAIPARGLSLPPPTRPAANEDAAAAASAAALFVVVVIGVGGARQMLGGLSFRAVPYPEPPRCGRCGVGSVG